MFRKRNFQERMWEILPGLQLWLVFVGAILLSYYQPVWAAVFIICFDLYWVLKAINVASHLIASYRKFQLFVTINWFDYKEKLNNLQEFLELLKSKLQSSTSQLEKTYYRQEISRLTPQANSERPNLNYKTIYHLILVPFTDENFEVLNSTFSALVQTNYPKDRMLLVLAAEERLGPKSFEIASKIKERYEKEFFKFFVTVHPD